MTVTSKPKHSIRAGIGLLILVCNLSIFVCPRFSPNSPSPQILRPDSPVQRFALRKTILCIPEMLVVAEFASRPSLFVAQLLPTLRAHFWYAFVVPCYMFPTKNAPEKLSFKIHLHPFQLATDPAVRPVVPRDAHMPYNREGLRCSSERLVEKRQWLRAAPPTHHPPMEVGWTFMDHKVIQQCSSRTF